jgi:hypothetical protein
MVVSYWGVSNHQDPHKGAYVCTGRRCVVAALLSLVRQFCTSHPVSTWRDMMLVPEMVEGGLILQQVENTRAKSLLLAYIHCMAGFDVTLPFLLILFLNWHRLLFKIFSCDLPEWPYITSPPSIFVPPHVVLVPFKAITRCSIVLLYTESPAILTLFLYHLFHSPQPSHKHPWNCTYFTSLSFIINSIVNVQRRF